MKLGLSIKIILVLMFYSVALWALKMESPRHWRLKDTGLGRIRDFRSYLSALDHTLPQP